MHLERLTGGVQGRRFAQSRVAGSASNSLRLRVVFVWFPSASVGCSSHVPWGVAPLSGVGLRFGCAFPGWVLTICSGALGGSDPVRLVSVSDPRARLQAASASLVRWPLEVLMPSTATVPVHPQELLSQRERPDPTSEPVSDATPGIETATSTQPSCGTSHSTSRTPPGPPRDRDPAHASVPSRYRFGLRPDPRGDTHRTARPGWCSNPSGVRTPTARVACTTPRAGSASSRCEPAPHTTRTRPGMRAKRAPGARPRKRTAGTRSVPAPQAPRIRPETASAYPQEPATSTSPAGPKGTLGSAASKPWFASL